MPDALMRDLSDRAQSATKAPMWWKLLAPLMHEDVRRRVTISSGVPRELVDALGGEAAVTRLSECSPHVL